MLFCLKLRTKKNNAHEEDIHRGHYRWMVLYPHPGRLHFFAPMDIVEYHDRRFRHTGKQLAKIPEGWRFAVVAINKRHIYCGKHAGHSRKGIVEIADRHPDIGQPQLLKMVHRQGSDIAAAFSRNNNRMRIGGRQVGG